MCRKLTQDVFVRVCRDSGFTIDATRAAIIAAQMLNKHPLEVWLAMPSLDVMDEIAAGRHAAAKR